ncbi:MAG TPA: hypothetical protein VFH31_10630, partial [Pyrinomonadaceae bacterium]|nr:hypothetical protein [Pyrinomonadaceae bacterium]
MESRRFARSLFDLTEIVYRLNHERKLAEIVRLWHAARGTPPPLELVPGPDIHLSYSIMTVSQKSSSSVVTLNRLQNLSWKKRIAYAGVIYFAVILMLLAVEVVTRLALPHISSLDLFINTPQQKAQVADPKQSGIFEGDPLLLWRLKPNLNQVYWDFTPVSTNSQHLRIKPPHLSVNPQDLRSDHVVTSKAPGTLRIVCLGDSVTFGYRVPPVWPERPTDYDPTWLPYPMLLEKHL